MSSYFSLQFNAFFFIRYEESAWGWNEKEKKLEMTEDSAWFLIAFTKEGNPIAFSHFRFDIDYGLPVLYWLVLFNKKNLFWNLHDLKALISYSYELQLEPECRSKGLGRFMLQILELMAFKANMKKVMLTVFLHNVNAVGFFKSLGCVLICIITYQF